MRAAPTFSTSAAAGFQILNASGSNAGTVSSVALGGSTVQNISVQISTSAGLVAGNAAQFMSAAAPTSFTIAAQI